MGDGPGRYARCKAWFGLKFEYAALAQVRFENNVRAIIHSGNDKEMHLGFRLVGSDGIIEVHDAEPHLRVRAKGSSLWKKPKVDGGLHSSKHPFMGDVFADITNALATGAEPQLAAARALRATEVIFSVFESSRKRARIDMPLKANDSALLTMLDEGVIG